MGKKLKYYIFLALALACCRCALLPAGIDACRNVASAVDVARKISAAIGQKETYIYPESGRNIATMADVESGRTVKIDANCSRLLLSASYYREFRDSDSAEDGAVAHVLVEIVSTGNDDFLIKKYLEFRETISTELY
jgi:hypothetical protein